MNNVAKEGLEEALSRQLRSTRERLGAMLGRQGEALSPWVLRRTLRELQNVADPAVSDVEGGRRAAGVAGWYARATPEQRRDCWLLMSDQFPPDPSAIETARAAYDAARGTDEEARAEVLLRKAFASPRTRLLHTRRLHILVHRGTQGLLKQSAKMRPANPGELRQKVHRQVSR